MNKATITKHRKILNKSSNDRSYSRSHEIKGNHPGEKNDGRVGQGESSGVKILCFACGRMMSEPQATFLTTT